MTTHRLRAELLVDRPIDEVFAFFSRPENLGRITPAGVVSLFDLKTSNAQPFGMTTGPNGTIWFTSQANQVGHVDGSAKRPQ